ncbi:hypothetical protein EJK55_0112 [Moraxella catarrhalis]|nr:hypothetical protein EJK55_0112 [Moraxella catarrhalis]
MAWFLKFNITNSKKKLNWECRYLLCQKLDKNAWGFCGVCVAQD